MGPRPCSLLQEGHFFSKFNYIKQNIRGCQSIPENLKILVSRYLKNLSILKENFGSADGLGMRQFYSLKFSHL